MQTFTVSFTTNWAPGTWVRWRFAKVGSSTVSLSPGSGTANGQALTGNSFVWTLLENL